VSTYFRTRHLRNYL